MAVLWSETRQGKHVEVRSAGNTRRLYVDGVLHSQYNPTQPLTGDIWDHLVLSACAAPKDAIQRVLVLGLGGGAAVQLLSQHFDLEQIVAVEIDPCRIDLASSFFGVGGSRISLQNGDARTWLDAYQGQPFDLVIDDICGESEGQPFRPIPFNVTWTRRLLGVLARPGWLAVNFMTQAELKKAVTSSRSLHRFPSAFRFSTPQSENAVTVFCGTPITRRRLRETFAPRLGLRKNSRFLTRFRLHTVWER